VAKEVGGTSVASSAMAGIMALVQQKSGAAQGLANPALYQLAAKDDRASCNSNTVANGNSCTFYDVTVGTNAMACVAGSANCVVNTAGERLGVVSGYKATTGYDLATGLGSINAYNLVNAWPAGSTSGGVSVSPATFAFPSTTVNTTSTATGVVTVSNGGTGAVSITSVTVTGTNASSFVITSNTCGATLAAAASCSISVAFDPTATGAVSASLAVTDSAAGSPQIAALGGTGTAPAPLTTTTTLASSSSSAGVGMTVTLTASVSKANGVATGAVTFLNGTQRLEQEPWMDPELQPSRHRSAPQDPAASRRCMEEMRRPHRALQRHSLRRWLP
jgi:hypothetical protein